MLNENKQTRQKARSLQAFISFLRCERGAVTVDFVVLTAAVVGLSVAVAVSVSGGTTEAASDVGKCMKIQGKIMSRDISYEKQLKRIQRRCSRL